MHYAIRHHSLTERHVNDLLEALEELLDVPELKCPETEDLFPSTLESMARARVVRGAVRDDLAGLEGAP